MSGRPLTPDEISLAASVFGDAIDYGRVRIHNSKWAFFHPRAVAMAPMGHIHFHPAGPHYCDDFCAAPLSAQGLFIHEMTHVWQTQQRGKYWLPLMRHPFCRYDYALKPGRSLVRYGIEQQAEIVRHAFLLAKGAVVPGAPPAESYRGILPFTPAHP